MNALRVFLTSCALVFAAGCFDGPTETVPGTQPGGLGSDPCVKTGCSSHVCSDEEVATTCEWRDSYACYQTAECKRQADGQCGFTMTDELKSCLEAANPSL
jgi:hypothetical protein